MSHARPAKHQSYAMIITRYQLQRTPVSHMNMLCDGVDITLMDTCVSVPCSNIYHTAALFSVGSDWYSLRLQTRKCIFRYLTLMYVAKCYQTQKMTFRTLHGVDNCHTRLPKNNIMGALRRVFFCQNCLH